MRPWANIIHTGITFQQYNACSTSYYFPAIQYLLYELLPVNAGPNHICIDIFVQIHMYIHTYLYIHTHIHLYINIWVKINMIVL